MVVPPGVLVNVQVPVAGRPVNSTSPVAIVQVGWVIVPTTGSDGVVGWALMITLADGDEVHPDELVTVNVYVPATSPDIVVLVPVPELVIPPGDLVTVQAPDDGKPVNSTFPVATVQVGWVIVPATGADGVTG